MSNNAPKTKWVGSELASGTYRQRLFVNGVETPFFIDSAKGIRAHKTEGDEHGLFGAGMGKLVENAKVPYRLAAVLGCASKVAPLKHRAEQMALSEATH